MAYKLPKGKWGKLAYWQCGEWQVVKEKLDDEIKLGVRICPGKENLFQALNLTPFEKTRVCIIGQDPYPNPRYATGVAFSIPEDEETFPASLRNVFTELGNDIGCPVPRSGSLLRWGSQGVLLWNAVPSCREGLAASHHWDEWTYLTKELVEKLDEERQPVFVLLGRHARLLRVHIRRSNIIETSHPSPLGANKGFLGSRIFSRTNAYLDQPIDWRLPCLSSYELNSPDTINPVIGSVRCSVETSSPMSPC